MNEVLLTPDAMPKQREDHARLSAFDVPESMGSIGDEPALFFSYPGREEGQEVDLGPGVRISVGQYSGKILKVDFAGSSGARQEWIETACRLILKRAETLPLVNQRLNHALVARLVQAHGRALLIGDVSQEESQCL